MSHVPENSIVAKRVASRRATSEASQMPAEAKKLKPAVPMWVWVTLLLIGLYGLSKLASAHPVVYVVFGFTVAIVRYFMGLGFRDLFSTPRRKD